MPLKICILEREPHKGRGHKGPTGGPGTILYKEPGKDGRS
jgi:hypothetical protein